MDRELLRKVQLTQLEIGLEVKRVCELLKINYFLDGLHSEDCTVSDDIKNHYEGIARWFRAYFYYGKLTAFGPVPWFDHCLKNDELDEMYKNRDSRDVIIGHIIDDLDFF